MKRNTLLTTVACIFAFFFSGQLIAQDEAAPVMPAAPVTPELPHKIGRKVTDPRVMYAYDAFTIPANLAGICAASIKAGEIKGIPVGLHVMAPAFKEDLLFNVLKAWEDLEKC